MQAPKLPVHVGCSGLGFEGVSYVRSSPGHVDPDGQGKQPPFVMDQVLTGHESLMSLAIVWA